MRPVIFISLLLLSVSAISQSTKIPLSHDVYDSWNDLENYQISRNGDLVTYEVNPQKGDGSFFWYFPGQQVKNSIERGKSGKILPSGRMIICRIENPYDTVRKMLLEGRKKKNLPKDSLAVIDLRNDTIMRFAEVFDFHVSDEKTDLVAFLQKQESDTISADTAATEKNKKDKKEEKKDLVVISNHSKIPKRVTDVDEFTVSYYGTKVTFIQSAGDSIDSCKISSLDPVNGEVTVLFSSPGYAKNISTDREGKLTVFHFSTDTAKIKTWGLRVTGGSNESGGIAIDTGFSDLAPGWSVSEHMKPVFSDDASRLYFGTAPAPEPEIKDTLTEDEKVSVDIWNWKDSRLQTQQLKDLEEDQKKNYLAVWHTDAQKSVQLADETVDALKPELNDNGRYLLGYDFKPYLEEISWKSSRARDVYVIDQQNGDQKRVLKGVRSSSVLSPEQDHIAWYNITDSSWYMYDIQLDQSYKVTSDSDHPFYDEEYDMPAEAGHYGYAGWTTDNRFIIYDRYDLYLADPEQGTLINITDSYGRKNNLRFRLIDLDKEQKWIDPKEVQLLKTFNEATKASGYYSLEGLEKIEKLIMDDVWYSNPVKADEADKLLWTRETFRQYPDLWISDPEFSSLHRITDINPQAEYYRWGTAELVNWVSLNGDSLSGLLYSPENYDPEQGYPMLVYFYEKYSDRLHRHYVPKPSRSVINFPYYVSNGYFIFIPDIVYRTGYPGQSCYDAVMAGTMKMLERPWIDKERMGLQGQSWGGYQVAYLVTQTDLFAAAMAGAPVSNMTSAYGGIRWGSGLSRMFQYEESQSRIGKTLWEDPLLYLENSPVFQADKVSTPLLIMHNDDDGAVPWYQGIELFVAMRRLHKPCWMLTYNKAPHNLSRRADMEDLTIRMQQFFDHFLKDEPAPLWMTEGIPAIKKGKEFGYELNGQRE